MSLLILLLWGSGLMTLRGSTMIWLEWGKSLRWPENALEMKFYLEKQNEKLVIYQEIYKKEIFKNVTRYCLKRKTSNYQEATVFETKKVEVRQSDFQPT